MALAQRIDPKDVDKFLRGIDFIQVLQNFDLVEKSDDMAKDVQDELEDLFKDFGLDPKMVHDKVEKYGDKAMKAIDHANEKIQDKYRVDKAVASFKKARFPRFTKLNRPDVFDDSAYPDVNKVGKYIINRKTKKVTHIKAEDYKRYKSYMDIMTNLWGTDALVALNDYDRNNDVCAIHPLYGGHVVEPGAYPKEGKELFIPKYINKSTFNHDDKDKVKPSHYKDGDHDLLWHLEDVLTKEQMRGAYKFNIIKYAVRYEEKNGIEDLEKLIEYAKRLQSFEDYHKSC